MFCPNCAAPNADDHSYCRRCGLKLAAIAKNVAEQFPSVEYAALARRIRRFELIGVASLSIAAIIGLSMLIVKAFQYKMILFGPDVLFYAAFAALLLFGLFSVFCFNYKEFVNFDKLNPRLPVVENEGEVEKVTTNRLLEDRIFEPASVTEHSTELLKIPRKRDL
ncbi:MAG: zinc ribbon domain-containing protein [Pyrinomonadaceae bacterium]